MTRSGKLIAAACLVLALSGAAPTSHVVVPAEEVKWNPAPASLPPGARAALLYGDPAKPGLFVMRLWFPKGYRIAPHTHPRPEVVTVISGGGRLGYGKVPDGAQTHRLAAGTFMVTPANAPHYARFDQDTVLQLNTVGPWSISYVNPTDDPRAKTR